MDKCRNTQLNPHKQFQKAIASELQTVLSRGRFPPRYTPKRSILPEDVWRARWQANLHCIPAHTLNKCIRVTMRSVRELSSNVPPRVTHAVLRACYHGWPCRSRCGVLRHRCPLCNGEQYDNLNHIMRCSFVRQTFARYKVCPLAEYRPEVFMLCDFRYTRNQNIVMSAILVAAFYKYLNKRRHGMPQSRNFAKQFDQYVDDAIRGHSNFCYDLVIQRRSTT